MPYLCIYIKIEYISDNIIEMEDIYPIIVDKVPVFSNSVEEAQYNHIVREEELCIDEIKVLEDQIKDPRNEFRNNILLEEINIKFRELESIQLELVRRLKTATNISTLSISAPFKYTPGQRYKIGKVRPMIVASKVNMLQTEVAGAINAPISTYNAGEYAADFTPVKPYPSISTNTYSPFSQYMERPINRSPSYIPQTNDLREHAIINAINNPIPSRDYAFSIQKKLNDLERDNPRTDFFSLSSTFYTIYGNVLR